MAPYQRSPTFYVATQGALVQSNGCLERWHGTLVPMFKKSLEHRLEWPKKIKFALYACRAAPNRDTGLTPFQLVCGRHLVVLR